jgi:hypothetical protein
MGYKISMKIKYAIWDQTSEISNRFLRQYIRDMFFEIKLDFVDVYVSHDLENILDNCNDAYDYLVVFGSGHIMTDIKLENAIHSLCNENFLIAGHIIHNTNEYPFLHPQMFIVNMKKYRMLGSPIIGYNETDGILLHIPNRSKDNVHDDYTPLWLKPSGEKKLYTNRKLAWNLIDISLNNDIPILNLPNDIRRNKRYLYPDYKPYLLSDCLQKLSNDNLTCIDKLNIDQTNHLKNLLTPGVFCNPFIFNTERLIDKLPCITPKRIFGAASGFKTFVIWYRFGKSSEVVYYDYNEKSLQIWKNIVNNWSGIDFVSFCKHNNYEYNHSKMQSVIDAVGGELNLQQSWNEFQQTNPRFIYCDIIRNPQLLLDNMLPDGNYVWYSNCFKYFESIRCYGLSKLDIKEKDFLNLLFKKASDTCFSGYEKEGFVKDYIA